MSNGFVILEMDERDLPDILKFFCEFKLESQAVSSTYDELITDYADVLKAELVDWSHKDDSLVLTAKDEGGCIIGFLIAMIWRYLPIYRIIHMGYISDLYIVPNWRGHGIGRALVTEAEEWFRSKGVKYARIDTMRYYVNNKAIYERFGYEVFLYDMRKEL